MRRFSAFGAGVLLAVCLLSGSAQASTGPLYDVKATWGPTNLPPGGVGQFSLQARNIGDEVAAKKLFITDELPPGVKITNIAWRDALDTEDFTSFCSGIGTETLSCVVPAAQTPELAAPSGLNDSGGVVSPQPTGYLLPIFAEVSIGESLSGTEPNVATVGGGGAPTAGSDVDQVTFSSTSAPFDVVPGSFVSDVFKGAYPEEEASRQAGDHPFEQRVDFDLTTKSVTSPFDGTLETPSNGTLRTAEVDLPRGLIGNPQALPKCDPLLFAQRGATANATRCPANTQVGYIDILGLLGGGNHGNSLQPLMPGANALLSRVPIYNLVPPKGTPVDLAFNAQNVVVTHIYATLDPSEHYAIKAVTPGVSALVDVLGSKVTLWGVPGDPAHDKLRYFSKDPKESTGQPALGAPFTAPIQPLFTNPMDCGAPNGGHRIRIDSYEHPGEFSPVQEYADPLDVTGCDDPRFRFEPKTSLQPTSKAAGAPIGLDVHLEVPQRDEEAKEAKELYAEEGFVKGVSTPPIKKVVVTFPKGMTLNSGAAQGLGACSPSQIGIDPQTGVPNDEPIRCPDSSQYGKLTLHTPALPVNEQPEGFLYIAEQGNNPFHNFLTLYLAIEQPDTGILVKLAGKVDLDPQTGQITTTFDELPQFPVSDIQLSLKGGLRAGLVNPQTCGRKTIEATFYSWAEPNVPHTVDNSYDIAQSQDGSPCFASLGERPFSPGFEAGTTNPLAGAFAPTEIDMTRSDQDQELSSITGTAPPGLLASLRGVARCSDAQIAAASDAARTGSEEMAHPSCPASSQVGTVDAGAGVGQVLTYVSGKIYLAGPYEGAPLSGVAIVPAVAGPFDLGVVVTRAPAYIDPETAQLTLKTDPLPQIFKGVPVRARDIRVHLDRPNFTLNPTSCKEMHLNATLFSAEGKSEDGSNRFQVGSCGDLGFKPRLLLKLKGATKRGGHPSLRAEVIPRAGDANIGSASVTLPHSAFLDQAHIRTICTRVQFAAHACPAGSVYGHAVVYTPLLDEPLEGPVYLRSSSHKLPDLVVALKGPPSLPIEFDLDGRVDSVRGGIRNTFEATPDAPFTKFVLEMEGGRKGLVINSTNLCAKANRASAKLSGHNGKLSLARPEVVAVRCRQGHGETGRPKRGPRSGDRTR